MRKQISYGLFITLTFLVVLSCKKTNDVIDKPNEFKLQAPIDFFSANPRIAEAKAYFENNIATSASQRFKKTPLWEKGFNATMQNGDEKVLVPLKYDKPYNFKTSFSGNKKFTLEEQSFLSVYKDVSGNFHADVITIYPDESFLNDMNQKFHGLLTIDDWNENRIKTYLYKDGKLYDAGKPHFNEAEAEPRKH
jgi:hypothetical protein